MSHLFFNRSKIFIGLLLCACSFLVACSKLNVYEKNISIPQYQWKYNLQPTFEFDITDTSAAYMAYVVLRHSDAYKYNNIWLNVGIEAPGDSMRLNRYEVVLGNDAKGWAGTGMDDIWELRKPITQGPVKLKKAGTYKFSLAQIMRENPLEHVMSVGIRVEKAQ